MKKETEIDKENVRLTYFHRQNQNVPNPTKCQKILSAIFSLCSAKAIKVEHRSLMDTVPMPGTGIYIPYDFVTCDCTPETCDRPRGIVVFGFYAFFSYFIANSVCK